MKFYRLGASVLIMSLALVAGLAIVGPGQASFLGAARDVAARTEAGTGTGYLARDLCRTGLFLWRRDLLRRNGGAASEQADRRDRIDFRRQGLLAHCFRRWGLLLR